jgi:hypothetical protein
VIGKHLGLHGLAPEDAKTRRDHGDSRTGWSMAGHRRVLRMLTRHDGHDASERP